VRPEVDDTISLEIVDGRHPVLDAAGTAFTPNDHRLDPADCQIVILTGPNMSGKSVFMRQTALLVILAQMGAFVPARSARIGLGGVAATPIRALETEAALTGRPWTQETVEDAAVVLAASGTPIDDQRSSARYRSAMLGQSLRRLHAEGGAEIPTGSTEGGGA